VTTKVIMMNRRSMLLWGSLIASVAASIWAISSPADDGIETSARSAPSPLALADDSTQPDRARTPSAARSDAAAPTAPDLQAPSAAAPGTRQVSEVRDDIFAAYSWEPPKPAVAAVKEPPRAPPVPFTFAGRLEAQGTPSYILAEGARMHVVAVGDKVGEFRLQQAESNALVFTHVPTNLPSTLAIPQ